ncbi:MAG: hypothetical protein ACD_79C00278G0001 [uncultured bacterium]|nr:MAG: hypothetical protein ACD_79C00278G0001 [uncultured bacterium]
MKIITKDLFEASYLMSQGMQLQNVSGDNQTVLFQFEGAEELSVLKSKYEKGRAEANVRQFRNSMNYLKDILFSKLRKHKTEEYAWDADNRRF